jgi:uncharacterized radical SAM superfamily protein
MKNKTEQDVVTITTTVALNDKSVEYTIKLNRNDVITMDPAAGNKALNDIMKQFYNKVNDNVKLALNDNI